VLYDDDDWAVKSPSGNMLGRKAFQDRDDRPLSMRERQERIRQEVVRKNSYAVSGLRPVLEQGQQVPTANDAVTATEPDKEARCFCF